MLVKTYGSAVYGVEAITITVEVNVSSGKFTSIVGLADNAVKESLERMESAIKTNGYHFPRTKVVVNLAPSGFWADKLRQHPDYAGSTAIGPAFMYAFMKSKKLYSQQREKLFKNISFLKRSMPPSCLENKSDLPVFICRDKDAEEKFYKKDMIISSFHYPYPDSEKMNRIIINALHTKKDLLRIGKVL